MVARSVRASALQAADQLLRQGGEDLAALAGRAGPVAGQVQHRQAAQFLGPVAGMGAPARGDVVGEGDRQRWERAPR